MGFGSANWAQMRTDVLSAVGARCPSSPTITSRSRANGRVRRGARGGWGEQWVRNQDRSAKNRNRTMGWSRCSRWDGDDILTTVLFIFLWGETFRTSGKSCWTARQSSTKNISDERFLTTAANQSRSWIISNALAHTRTHTNTRSPTLQHPRAWNVWSVHVSGTCASGRSGSRVNIAWSVDGTSCVPRGRCHRACYLLRWYEAYKQHAFDLSQNDSHTNLRSIKGSLPLLL